jgi:hypothetical protein
MVSDLAMNIRRQPMLGIPPAGIQHSAERNARRFGWPCHRSLADH